LAQEIRRREGVELRERNSRADAVAAAASERVILLVDSGVSIAAAFLRARETARERWC
jgi:predicted phosphoribosyltransferase